MDPKQSALDNLQNEMMDSLDDHDFDELLKNRPRRYKPFDWDNIDKELSHPLFKIRDPNYMPTQEEIDNNEHLSALQALKYDGETPYEKAEELKFDGNEHFKRKWYKKALIAYSAGLALNPTEFPENFSEEEKISKPLPNRLRAILANNRASTNFYLKNYRSAITDSCISIKNDKIFVKPYYRAVQCLIKLEYYQDAIDFCKRGINDIDNSDDDQIQKFNKSISECKSKLQILERNKRKKIAEKRQLLKQLSKISALATCRNYPEIWTDDHVNNLKKNTDDTFNLKFDDENGDSDDNLTSSNSKKKEINNWLLTLISNFQKNKITLIEDKYLTFPVIFYYPEYKTTDVIEFADERTVAGDLLATMFEQLPPWDENETYQYQNLELYYTSEDNSTGVKFYEKLDQELLLSNILMLAGVHDGVLNLYVVSNYGHSKKFKDKFIKEKF